MSFKPDPKIVEKFKYCPACSKPFHERKLLDVFAKGYECENSHRYFCHIEMVTMNETLPKHMELLSEEVEVGNIVKDWLLRKPLRGHLNPQLATMLRACLEIEASEFKKTKNIEKFCFCPWCSADVKEVPSTDAWVIAKNCQNGHEFKERGYHIGYKAVFLEHEITYNFLKDCLKSYLNEQEPSKYVPNQLKPVLEIFRKKLIDV